MSAQIGRRLFFVGLLFLFVYALVTSLDFGRSSRLLPIVAASIGIVAVALQLLADWRRRDRDTRGAAQFDVGAENKEGGAVKFVRYLVWICGFQVVFVLFGMYVSAFAFITAFYLIEARATKVLALVTSTALVGSLYLLQVAIGLHYPMKLF